MINQIRFSDATSRFAALRADQKLVTLFICGYNGYHNDSYTVVDWPDSRERQRKAIEAIARNDLGRSLAVEHTLLQPFVGEKEDAQRFLAAMGPLEANQALRIPDCSITLSLPVGALPKGVNWQDVGKAIRSWFEANRLQLPEGTSSRVVSVGTFKVQIQVEKIHIPSYEGRVFVARSEMPETFAEVLKQALGDKLPKLAGTPADGRILLLEKDNLPRGYAEVARCIDRFEIDFAELASIQEVWIANTVSWASEGAVFFYQVWPGGVTDKLKVLC